MARRKSRKQIHKKVFPSCFFCGNPEAHRIDAHRIIPGAEGGRYVEPNILSACANCHRDIHEGVIVVDRKYRTSRGGVWIVHYWKSGEEFWKYEEPF